MPKSKPPYAPEYRRQMVELVRVGRKIEALAVEFGVSANSIRKWVRQADIDEGHRQDGASSEERQEPVRLRRENKQLRIEREILSKAAAWFAGRPGRSPRGIRVREGAPSDVSDCHDVSPAGCLHQRLLRVAPA